MNEYDSRYSVNIDDLRDRHMAKCNIRSKIYEKLLEKCYFRVNNASENDLTYCIYPIPDFVLGMPTYNVAYCAAYIMFDLKRNGFNAKFFNPNIIFVYWNYEQPSYIRHETITYTKPKLLLPPSSNTNKVISIPTVPNNTHKQIDKKPVSSNFRSINDYKPSGNFIYK